LALIVSLLRVRQKAEEFILMFTETERSGGVPDEVKEELLIRDLGKKFEICNIYFKFHSACRHAHAPVDAALNAIRDSQIDPSEITKISNNLNLPKNILETASVIYRKAVKEHLIRGRSIQGVTSAAIYVACRQCGLARTLEEIAQASNINKKEVGRSYRFLIKELNYFIPPLKPSSILQSFRIS
jgi:hypothetical protein